MKSKYCDLIPIIIGGILLKTGLAFSQDHKFNVLLFTADDLDRNSLGCYGSGVPDISPNLDRFASQGIRFNHAFVNASISAPSRGIIATGLYGHNSGVKGFMKMPEGSKIPLLMEILRENKYTVGILGKVSHSTPKSDFIWDYVFDQQHLGDGRSPSVYYEKAKAFFRNCRETGKPFYFMVNSHDPHRPFFNPDEPVTGGAERPSRIYNHDEIEVPGFVPDLPLVRRELSYYFNSVKRLDDTFGKVMQALEESGFKENTLVIFLSDNGIAIPFAKCNTYYASNRTPWLVRWPGIVKAGLVDDKHYISEVDLLPTILEAAGIHPPEQLDGNSHLALYRGEEKRIEKYIFSQIDYKAGGGPVPMRSIQNGGYIYIYNAWSDGERIYANNNEGLTMRAIEMAAENDPDVENRVKTYRIREPEEFYNVKNDPDCMENLINDPSYIRQIRSMRKALEKWMVKTHDPLIEVYRQRYSPPGMLEEFYEAYPEAQIWDQNKSHYSK